MKKAIIVLAAALLFLGLVVGLRTATAQEPTPPPGTPHTCPMMGSGDEAGHHEGGMMGGGTMGDGTMGGGMMGGGMMGGGMMGW